jgi:hypothetical protein
MILRNENKKYVNIDRPAINEVIKTSLMFLSIGFKVIILFNYAI